LAIDGFGRLRGFTPLGALHANSNQTGLYVSPDLELVSIETDVDPVVDSVKIADQIAELKKK